MTKPLSRVKKVAIGATVVLGSLGIGGASAALLGTGTASGATTTPSTPTSGAANHAHRFLRRHTVDATITVKTKKGYETLNVARGTVGTISPTSITVNSPDGTSLTATINAQTKFHNTTDGQLQPGDKVGVIASQGVAKAINAPKTAGSSTSTASTTS